MNGLVPSTWPRTFSVLGLGAISLTLITLAGITIEDNHANAIDFVMTMLTTFELVGASTVILVFVCYIIGEGTLLAGNQIFGVAETLEERSRRDASVDELGSDRLSLNYDRHLHAVELWRSIAVQSLLFGIAMTAVAVLGGEWALAISRMGGALFLTIFSVIISKKYLTQIDSDIFVFRTNKRPENDP